MSSPSSPPRPRLGRRFLVVWAGQTVSTIGTTVSAIAVGVHVYLQTRNAVWLGLIGALVGASALVAAPIGALIDRYDRRRVMLAADSFAALGPAFALTMATFGELHPWHLLVSSVIGGVGNAVQSPAASAAMPQLAGEAALGRANGLTQLTSALGLVLGPIIATPLIAAAGIKAALIVDLATFAVALIATSLVRFGAIAHDGPTDRDGGFLSGLAWLRRDARPLLTLIGGMAVVNLALSFFNISVQVIAVNVAGVSTAGTVFAVGGAAMIVGSLIVAARGVPEQRIGAFAAGLAVFAVGVTIAAARPHLAFVLTGVVVALGAVPAVSASVATVFQEHVPDQLRGRVFGVRHAVAGSLDPIGNLAAGLLIAKLAEPLMTNGRIGATTLGKALGAGPGRGAAAVLLVAAIALVSLAVWFARSTRLRPLDRRAPDASHESHASTVEATSPTAAPTSAPTSAPTAAPTSAPTAALAG